MIKVHNLSVIKDDIKILNNISFKINKGDFIFFAGLNGSGKSTLIRSLLGLEEYSGEIILKEKPSIIFQSTENYFFQSTIIDEIKFSLGENDNIKIKNLKEQFNIKNDNNTNPNDLSGGEKERLAIACATAKKPKVLILDETLAMNDATNKEKIFKILKKLNNEGMAIILISHDFSDIKHFKRLLILDNKIIEYNVGEIKIKQLKNYFYIPNYEKVKNEIY